MKLVKPSFKITAPEEINGDLILRQIEAAARTCYKSEDKIGDMLKCPMCKEKEESEEVCPYCMGTEQIVSWRDLAIKLLKRGHYAMIEFAPDITVKFVCDRGVSHKKFVA